MQWTRRRPLEYPRPQYSGPINIDTNALPWAPFDGAPGVEVKPLGTFTNCGYGASEFKIAPNSKFNAVGRCVYLVLTGRGTISADEEYEPLTAIYLEDGDRATFDVVESTELLALQMPTISQIGKPAQVH